jgi:transposase, IS30 family
MLNPLLTNRLLRQYLHKTADLGSLTQDHLNSVAAKINHRPRRVLGFITRAEAFDRVQHTARLASV